MKFLLSPKTFLIVTVVSALFLIPIALSGTAVFATTCSSAGSTGLTAKIIATSNQKITSTTVNATGCDIGIYVGPGTTGVAINGVTVSGANEHGIFVQDASWITIENNLVQGNGVNRHACPPAGPPPVGCIAEDKAIQLSGTSNSVVERNIVKNNIADGGIGVSDDGAIDPGAPNTHPGTSHGASNVLVKGNLILNNANGCGVVVAAYNPSAPTSTDNGHDAATLAANSENGNKGSGAGNPSSGINDVQVIGNNIIGQPPSQPVTPPGPLIGQIVVATDGPNAVVSNVVVEQNNLDGAFLPGIVVHSNVFGDKILNTIINENTIADPGYYPGPPATNPNTPGVSQGTTGISIVAEVGGPKPPGAPDPVLSHTEVVSNAVLNAVNGVWLCGTDHTDIHGLQGNPTNLIVTCHAGGS